MARAAIGVVVPAATDVTKLAPTFTISPLAQAAPVSGTARDFTRPQTYSVTAQDGSSQVYTVTVIKASDAGQVCREEPTQIHPWEGDAEVLMAEWTPGDMTEELFDGIRPAFHGPEILGVKSV
jgi:hypothetical protein